MIINAKRQNFYLSNFKKFETNPEIAKAFREEELKGLKETPWMTIICFKGFETIARKVIEIYYEISKKYTSSKILMRAAFVIPPTKFFTENDILELNRLLMDKAYITSNYGYQWDNERKELIIDFLMKKKKLSKEGAILFQEHLYSPFEESPWDDRQLYRIFSLIKFHQQSQHSSYGEFLKDKHNEIIDLTIESDFRMFEPYLEFVHNMMKKKNVLTFIEKNDEQNMGILDDMNKQEAKTLMSLPKQTVPISKHTTVLQRALEVVRSDDEMTYNDIFITLSNISIKVAQREEYSRNDRFLESIEIFQTAIKSFKSYMKKSGLHPDIVSLVKTIDKHQNELSMLDIIVLIRFFLKNNYVIRSSEFEKSMSVFKQGVKVSDNPVAFIKFLTKIFSSHEGAIPTPDEWLKFLSTVEDSDIFQYPLSLVLPMITDTDSSLRASSMRVVEDARDKHSSITLDEDRD